MQEHMQDICRCCGTSSLQLLQAVDSVLKARAALQFARNAVLQVRDFLATAVCRRAALMRTFGHGPVVVLVVVR